MILPTFDYAVFCVARSGPQEGLKIWVGGQKLIQQFLKSSTVWKRFCFYFCQNLGRGGPRNPPPPPTRSNGPARYSCCSDICWCSKKVMLEFRIACEAEVSADFKTSRNFVLANVLAKPLTLIFVIPASHVLLYQNKSNVGFKNIESHLK